MNLRRVLAIAGDPGGAKALAPVLLRLAERKDLELRTLGYRQASAIFAAAGLETENVDEAIGSNACGAYFRDWQPDLLFCATSANGVDLEKTFIHGARERHVPSLALLDFWSGYRRRFSDADDRLVFQPDVIAVMDEMARDAMIAAGFDPQRLVVTGQPALDDLAAWRARHSPSQIAAMRSGFGVQAEELLVVLIGQPIVEVYGTDPAASGHPGFTEMEVVPRLIRALADFGTETAGPIFLLIRPHPRDPAGKYETASLPGLRIEVSAVGDHRAMLLAADLVVGMSSAPMMDAAFLGRPTISFQPGLQGADPLPTNHLSLSQGIYDEAGLPEALRQAFVRPADDHQRVAHSYLNGEATGCVLSLISSLLTVSKQAPQPAVCLR